jgi:hypothetical protein
MTNAGRTPRPDENHPPDSRVPDPQHEIAVTDESHGSRERERERIEKLLDEADPG